MEHCMPQNPPVISGTRIGHVHLKVADLDRALGFYCDVLGFELMQRMGTQAAFISAGGYHHHIGLNTWERQCGFWAHPSRRGLKAAPQDEVVVPSWPCRPRIMTSASAVNSSAMQP